MIVRSHRPIQGKSDNRAKCWEEEETEAQVSGGSRHNHQEVTLAKIPSLWSPTWSPSSWPSGWQAGDRWTGGRWVGGTSKEKLLHRAAWIHAEEYSLKFHCIIFIWELFYVFPYSFTVPITVARGLQHRPFPHGGFVPWLSSIRDLVESLLFTSTCHLPGVGLDEIRAPNFFLKTNPSFDKVL